jgi:hypothetical protein
LRKILLLVEGQTEETFVKNLPNPHLKAFGKFIEPKIIATKIVKRGDQFKGGVPSYDAVRRLIVRLLNDSSAILVGTFIDYYGLPNSFPGKQTVQGNTPIERVQYLEQKLREDIPDNRFLPYYSLHEFEAILFSRPSEIAKTLTNPAAEQELTRIRQQFPTPEDINDNAQTCPSARIKRLFPRYQKPLFGSLISQRIGLNQIRAECKHFGHWLSTLEQI